MNELPILVKPYYTLEETYERLRIAGAYLNQPSDILQLAKEEMIEIQLLLYGKKNVLVNKNDAVPYLHSHRWGKFDLQGVLDDLVHGDFFDHIEIEKLVPEIKNHEYMLFTEHIKSRKEIINFELHEYRRDLIFPDLSNCIVLEDNYPILVTPLEMFGAMQFWSNNNTFFENETFFESKSFNWWIKPFSVRYKGEVYFVCKWDVIAEVASISHGNIYAFARKKDGELVECPTMLDRDILASLLINNENKVVSIESLKEFENKYLGIEHKSISNDGIKYSPPKTVQYQREQLLAELINQHEKNELIILGRLGVWNELTTMDSNLFPFRDSAEASTVKRFFDNQKLITFKRGR